MLYEPVGSRCMMIGGVRTDMDIEGCQTNLMLLEHEANKCKEDSPRCRSLSASQGTLLSMFSTL